MPGVDEVAIGERIGQARDAAQLSQGDLASAVKLDRSAVNKIERGGRRVTAFELSEIARILGRPMEWFLSPPTAAIVSHRTRYGSSEDSIDVALERVAREIEFVQSLTDRLALRRFEPLSVPGSADQAEQLAGRVRAAANVGDGPVVQLASAAEQLGLMMFSQPLGEQSGDGASVLLATGGVALINSDSAVGRRRVTAAHEIGHYVVADEYTVDWNAGWNETNNREALLDRFARALLCPAQEMRPYWTRTLADSDDLRAAALKTAAHWRVDFTTLARRLSELHLVEAAQAGEIRNMRATRADYVELNLFVPTDLENVTTPRSFQRAVFDLYRKESITADRALDLLQGTYEATDLPQRPVPPEASAWQIIW